jgi:hypothetical protein
MNNNRKQIKENSMSTHKSIIRPSEIFFLLRNLLLFKVHPVSEIEKKALQTSLIKNLVNNLCGLLFLFQL